MADPLNQKGATMRRFIACFVITIALTSVSQAQDDPNVKLMKQLYTKIGQAVGVGSNDPQTGETFLVLANPGILLDPNLAWSTPQGSNQLARAIDKVLTPNWIYGTRNTTAFAVYNRILTDHEPAVISPTDEQVRQYKLACQLVFTDCDSPTPGNYTDAWNRYVDRRSKLATITKQAEDYRKNNQTDDLPADIANELQVATDDLDLIGNKATLQGAKATIDTYNHIDPNSWWGEVSGVFNSNSQSFGGNKFGNLNLYPSYPVWLDMSRSWTKLALNQSDLQQTTSSSSTSVGGGGGFSAGLWSVGADYSHQEQRTYFKLDASGYTVAMELMRVTIDRPWMDETVFESQAWKFLAGTPYYNKLISSGADAPSGVTPPDSDVMPFLPTGLLLARRVSLSGGWTHDLQTTFHQHTSAGGSVGWGPFSFSGRYESDDASSYTEAHAAGNTISWDAPQIIGFFVQVLPKNPQPYRCYHFASDTQPLPPDCLQLAQDHPNLFNFNRSSQILLNSPLAQSPDALLDHAKEILRKMHASRAVHGQPPR
jgi:hypothetical protein